MLYSNNQNNMRTQMPNGCGTQRGRAMSPGNMTPSGCGPSVQMPGGGTSKDWNCGCNGGNNNIEQFTIAMSYVPWQQFGEVYPLDRGFHIGTIFPALDLPFLCANPACSGCGCGNSGSGMKGGKA